MQLLKVPFRGMLWCSLALALTPLGLMVPLFVSLLFLLPSEEIQTGFGGAAGQEKDVCFPQCLVWEGTRLDVSTQLLQQSLCVIPNYFAEFRQGLTALLPGWRGLACGQPHCRGWRGCLQSLAGLFQDSKTTPIQVLKWSSESQLYF